jgi:hypothetical protein
MTTAAAVPGIMRAKSWKTGAALMDHWMSLPASAAPPYAHRNDSIVTMKWVKGFEVAKAVYDQLMRDEVWFNAAARAAIIKMLQLNSFLDGKARRIGVFASTHPVIHQNAVNFRVVSQPWLADLDDLAAALANFTFHVQVGGDMVWPKADQTVFTIDTVGIYIRDQYDFVGDQSLGYWRVSDNNVTKTWRPGSTEMTNESFRNWRTANGKGGDFEVFSDVEIKPLTKKCVFTINVTR